MPPSGFVFTLPGPTNHQGASFEISIKPLFVRNHPPTRPPCKPIQPHSELLSLNLISASNIPSKNKPERILVISQKGISNPM